MSEKPILRRQQIMELAMHESSVEECEWERQLNSPYAYYEDKERNAKWMSNLGAICAFNIGVVGVSLATAVFDHLNFPGLGVLGLLTVISSPVVGSVYMDSWARKNYFPLRNNDGLDYFDLRKRALEDGRIGAEGR